jgi:Tfp pilus assembly protein PilV
MISPASVPASARSTGALPSGVASQSRRRQAGFTIAEVGIAAMVLLLCIASSLVTLGYGYKAIDNARYTTLAGQILQSQMEKLRMLTWAQLTDPTSGPPASGSFTADVSSSTSGMLSQFTALTQTIANSPVPFNTTMKDITLTATWRGADGRSHTLTYTTRYGQNGLSDFFYTAH